MKLRNGYLLSAGLLNLFTAFLHTIDGQRTLVDPMMASNLSLQVKAELLAVWHLVTIMLFVSSFVLLRQAFAQQVSRAAWALGYLYLFFALAFIMVSLVHSVFAPQWTLLLPIGVLAVLGGRKSLHISN